MKQRTKINENKSHFVVIFVVLIVIFLVILETNGDHSFGFQDVDFHKGHFVKPLKFKTSVTWRPGTSHRSRPQRKGRKGRKPNSTRNPLSQNPFPFQQTSHKHSHQSQNFNVDLVNFKGKVLGHWVDGEWTNKPPPPSPPPQTPQEQEVPQYMNQSEISVERAKPIQAVHFKGVKFLVHYHDHDPWHHPHDHFHHHHHHHEPSGWNYGPHHHHGHYYEPFHSHHHPYGHFDPHHHHHDDHHDHHEHHHDDGWGWHHGWHHGWWGWGWGWKKICGTEPAFSLNSISDIPANSTFRTGSGKPAILSDLPQFLVPKPPSQISVGVNTQLPSEYLPMMTNIFAVSVDPDSGPMQEKNETFEGERSNSSSEVGRNSYQITTMLIQSPVLSVPLNGTISRFFTEGLEVRKKEYANDEHITPMQSQVNILARLWADVDIEEDEHFDKRVPFSSPLVVSMVQRFSVPEPDTSEKAILDASFNFGLQANRISFGDYEIVSKGWKKGRQEQQNSTEISPESIASMSEFNEWVRSHSEALRGASEASYEPTEEMASEIFEQDQYFIMPPGACVAAVDPQKNRGAVSMNCMSSSVDVRGPSRKCFPPRRC